MYTRKKLKATRYHARRARRDKQDAWAVNAQARLKAFNDKQGEAQ